MAGFVDPASIRQRPLSGREFVVAADRRGGDEVRRSDWHPGCMEARAGLVEPRANTIGDRRLLFWFARAWRFSIVVHAVVHHI